MCRGLIRDHTTVSVVTDYRLVMGEAPELHRYLQLRLQKGVGHLQYMLSQRSARYYFLCWNAYC